MQSLDLSGSETRTESRLKSLFWPSIRTGSDVDYLSTQGFWVCTLIATLSLVYLTLQRKPLIGGLVSLLYFLSGVGVRERSRYAAAVVFVSYVTDAVLGGAGVVRILFSALLLSNLRATWIASHWKPGSDAASLPPRFSDTWTDKIADQMPMWLWPKIRIAYYVVSIGYILLVTIGLLTLVRHRFN